MTVGLLAEKMGSNLLPDFDDSSLLVPTKRMQDGWFAGAFNNKFIAPARPLLQEARDRVRKIGCVLTNRRMYD